MDVVIAAVVYYFGAQVVQDDTPKVVSKDDARDFIMVFSLSMYIDYHDRKWFA